MPDSQFLPTWDLAHDERDLDALLSGESGGIPESLRPVACTLAALRSAAARSELSGEEAARAAFRAAFPVIAPARPAWAEEAERGTVPQRTLILPSGGRLPRGAARHRRSHRTRRGIGSRRPVVLVGSVAAVVVAVLAIVFTGLVPGPIDRLASFGRDSADGRVATKGTGRISGSQGVDGTGVSRTPASRPKPAGTPAPPAETPQPGALCRTYFAFYTHPESATAWTAERTLARRLSELAGSRWNIGSYCRPYLDYSFWDKGRGTFPPPAPGAFPAGSGGAGDAGQPAPSPGGRSGGGWPSDWGRQPAQSPPSG